MIKGIIFILLGLSLGAYRAGTVLLLWNWFAAGFFIPLTFPLVWGLLLLFSLVTGKIPNKIEKDEETIWRIINSISFSTFSLITGFILSLFI